MKGSAVMNTVVHAALYILARLRDFSSRIK